MSNTNSNNVPKTQSKVTRELLCIDSVIIIFTVLNLYFSNILGVMALRCENSGNIIALSQPCMFIVYVISWYDYITWKTKTGKQTE